MSLPAREAAWRTLPEGLELHVRAQPGARRAGLLGTVPGVDGPRVKVAVREPPLDGRANAAILALLGKALGVAPSRLAIVQGELAREKTIRVEGDAAALAARIAELLA